MNATTVSYTHLDVYKRQEYINSVKANLRSQLNNINIQNEDGSVINLGKEHAE